MKTKSKQRLKSAVSILLMLAVVITGAFAYFTATDSKKNVFTIGNVDIVLHEDDWTEPDENGDSQHIDGDNINVLPGDKISKAPYIENTGDNNAWVYMTIGIPTIQRDTSRADDLAISFTNTNIPVEAYALQEGYGNVDGSQAMWDAYFADKSDDKFGTAVTDETALLNRVELFNLPDIDSSWTQLGEVFKSEDGFNYYVFAYNDVIEPTSNTTPVIEWVQLNPALTQNDDVLFSPDAASVAYFVKNDIGEAAAQEIYGAQADYEYAGAIELDYVPEQDDAYYVSNADAMLTFNATSSQWEIESTEENPVDADLIPDTILNKTATVIDPQADPDPNHAPPEIGDEYETADAVYKYGYRCNASVYGAGLSLGDWVIHKTPEQCFGWGYRVKDTTLTEYEPMKNEIWGQPVTCGEGAFFDCVNLITAPKLSKNLKLLNYGFKNCTSLTTVPSLANVEDLTYAFINCTSLVTAPNIPDSVTSLASAFSGCTSLTEAPEIPNNVIYLASAFEGCTALVNPPDMSNATSVTNMSNAFKNCTSLTSAPKIPSSVTKMYGTFYNCSSLISPPDMSDATSVTDMEVAFEKCTSLVNPPDLSHAISVTNMDDTFSECTKLEKSPVIPESVTSMECTFYKCTSLTSAPQIPEGVTDMYGTFWRCSSLSGTIIIPNSVTTISLCFDSTGKPITMKYYSSCTAAVNYSGPSNVTKVCIDA